MSKLLCFENLPSKLCHLAIHTVSSVMGSNFIPSLRFFDQIVLNLKRKVILSFKEREESLNEKYIIQYLYHRDNKSSFSFNIL